MPGIEDRVKGFLESWPIIEKNLREVLADDERLLHGYGVSGPLPGESKDDLPEIMGQGNTGL